MGALGKGVWLEWYRNIHGLGSIMNFLPFLTFSMRLYVRSYFRSALPTHDYLNVSDRL